MAQYNGLTPEERSRITEIQDLLIDRYVKQKEALERGEESRVEKIEVDIKNLQREKEKIEERAIA